MDTAPDFPPSEIIDEMMGWFYKTGALRAALELQLWEKVAPGNKTAEEIAAQEGWDLAGTRVLLDAITALKLLNKYGARYSLTQESACYLLREKPIYKGHLLMNEYHWEGNGKLAQTIRDGKRPFCYDATSEGMVGIWIADYARSWTCPESYLEDADRLWQSLGIQACDGLAVLDIACGPAPRSLALARQHPGVRLTWLDWERVLQTGLDVAARLKIADQVSSLPGDCWSLDIGRNAFDAAYLGNLTHFFSPQENTSLFRKVHAALKPGGIIVVHSVARRENERSVWDGLWLYAATAAGGVYDFDMYKEMLENAGFQGIEDINLGPIKAKK